nr:hypothetical protein [Tanacetum cinerariifolium]
MRPVNQGTLATPSTSSLDAYHTGSASSEQSKANNLEQLVGVAKPPVVDVNNPSFGTPKSNIQGVCGALDGAVSPPDDQVMAKLVKLVKMGDLQIVWVSMVDFWLKAILRRPWFHAILDLTSVLTPSLLLVDRSTTLTCHLGSCRLLALTFGMRLTNVSLFFSLLLMILKNHAAEETPSSQRIIVSISCFVVTMLRWKVRIGPSVVNLKQLEDQAKETQERERGSKSKEYKRLPRSRKEQQNND